MVQEENIVVVVIEKRDYSRELAICLKKDNHFINIESNQNNGKVYNLSDVSFYKAIEDIESNIQQKISK